MRETCSATMCRLGSWEASRMRAWKRLDTTRRRKQLLLPPKEPDTALSGDELAIADKAKGMMDCALLALPIMLLCCSKETANANVYVMVSMVIFGVS